MNAIFVTARPFTLIASACRPENRILRSNPPMHPHNPATDDKRGTKICSDNRQSSPRYIYIISRITRKRERQLAAPTPTGAFPSSNDLIRHKVNLRSLVWPTFFRNEKIKAGKPLPGGNDTSGEVRRFDSRHRFSNNARTSVRTREIIISRLLL